MTTPLVIGVTGEIGAGKSTVSQRFAELGALVIDADKVGHGVLRRNETIKQLVDEFGESIINETRTVDRKTLGRKVFADASSHAKLESIMHPVMRVEFERQIEAGRSDAPLIILDAAILFEAGWNDLCNHAIFVGASRETRLRRLSQSRQWTDDELTRREQAQMPADRKRRLCDVVVSNDESLAACRRLVDQLFTNWAVPAANLSITNQRVTTN